MVHALTEIRRVLLPGGVLLDVRPLMDRWQIEVVSARGSIETGRVNDYPEPVAMDAAANQAIENMESLGWFRREQEEVFPFFYSWDLPSEMEEFIAEEWSDVIRLSDEARQATRAAWSVADADSRVRLKLKILITRWKKQTEEVST
jgi:hypothetical protein